MIPSSTMEIKKKKTAASFGLFLVRTLGVCFRSDRFNCNISRFTLPACLHCKTHCHNTHFHQSCWIPHFPTENTGPLVECRRSSRTYYLLFCETPAKRPKLFLCMVQDNVIFSFWPDYGKVSSQNLGSSSSIVLSQDWNINDEETWLSIKIPTSWTSRCRSWKMYIKRRNRNEVKS